MPLPQVASLFVCSCLGMVYPAGSQNAKRLQLHGVNLAWHTLLSNEGQLYPFVLRKLRTPARITFRVHFLARVEEIDGGLSLLSTRTIFTFLLQSLTLEATLWVPCLAAFDKPHNIMLTAFAFKAHRCTPMSALFQVLISIAGLRCTFLSR